MSILLLVLSVLPKMSAREYLFREVISNRDLLDARLNLIHQDSAGYLYVGCSEGVYISDGLNTSPVRFPDSLQEARATSFASPDNSHTLIGLDNGTLLNYDAINDRLEYLGNIGKGAEIRDLQVTPEGTIWAAAYGTGLIFMEDSIYYYSEENGLLSNFTYCLETDRDGRVWAGTDGGLNIITREQGRVGFLSMVPATGLADYIVTSLHATQNGNMIIGFESGQVEMYGYSTGLQEKVLCRLAGSINKILSYGGETLILSDGECFILPDTGTEEVRKLQFRHPVSDPGRIHDIFVDRNGFLWITGEKAILMSCGRNLTIFDMPEVQEVGNVQAILPDRERNLWFSIENRLYRQSIEKPGGKGIVARTSVQSSIISLYEDDNGYIWIGTFNDGLYILDPESGRSRHITGTEGLPDKNILDITGSDSLIWISGLEGISALESSADPLSVRRLQNLLPEELEGSNMKYVFDIQTGKDGTVWFGTDGDGLFGWNGGRFVRYDLPQRENGVIYSVAMDRRGVIWMAEAYTGIYSYDGISFRNFAAGTGLRSVRMTGMAEDGHGHLVIGHRDGIDIFQIETGQFAYLDDYTDLNFRNIRINALESGVPGEVWIASDAGIFRVETGMGDIFNAPLTHIRSIEVKNHRIDPGGRNEWKYSSNNIRFRISSVCFSEPTRLKYRYKLENLESEWTMTRGTEISYPALPPGSYRFTVQSSLTPDFSRATTAGYSFTIKKPFWKKTWFLSFAVSTVLGLLLVIIRRREASLKRREAVARQQITLQLESLRNQVNPHFLFNSFNTLISVIEEDSRLAIDYVEKLSDFFRNVLVYSSRDLIPLREELDLLESYAYLQRTRFGKRLELEIDIPEEFLGTGIPSLSLQILLENAIKHNIASHSDPLKIRLSCSDEGIRVENNLRLKKTAEPSTRTGLRNIEARYGMLGGKKLRVMKNDESFVVILPLIREYD